MERCKIASEADFFFKMGFFCRKEDDVDIRLGGGEAVVLSGLLVSVCNGPYNQVTSQSLSQFKLSGEMVFSPYLAFVHVLQEAFSRRTLLL